MPNITTGGGKRAQIAPASPNPQARLCVAKMPPTIDTIPRTRIITPTIMIIGPAPVASRGISKENLDIMVSNILPNSVAPIPKMRLKMPAIIVKIPAVVGFQVFNIGLGPDGVGIAEGVGVVVIIPSFSKHLTNTLNAFSTFCQEKEIPK
jgi:hypothetical protein